MIKSDHKIGDFLLGLELAIRKLTAIRANELMRHQKPDQNARAISAQNQIFK